MALVLPALIALAISFPLLWFLFSRLLQQGAANQLANTLPLVTGLVEEHLSLNAEDLQTQVAGLTTENQIRITIVAHDGTVLADSDRTWTEVLAMDNHAERLEIAAAREHGAGTSKRRSATTGQIYVYAAEMTADRRGAPTIIRLAQPVEGLDALRRELALVMGTAATVALAAMVAWLWWLQRLISRATPELLEFAEHLESGDFSYRMEISPQTELGRLGQFLNQVAAQAQNQIEDLTIQRQHLLTVVSSMREGVLVTDAEGFVRLANPAFRQLFDIDDEVDGRTPLELTRQEQLEDLIVRTLTTGEPQIAEVQVHGPPNRTVALAGTHLGGGVGTIVVARDVTELVLSGRMRRDLVANVSHELKTPLTAIRGYAETLRYGEVDDEETGRRFVDRILQQCARLQALLEDLLTLSRLESLEDQSERTPVRLDTLLEECLDSIAPQVAEKEIELEVEAQPMLTFDGDRDALERLVINLLDNAVKYNRKGGRVDAHLLQEKGQIVFSVSDTGIGIPASSLTRVFERFYRVDKGRSRDEGGTGLGLAIVKHVAQLHGGHVEVQSQLGGGSTFRVHLPAHPT